MRFELLPLLEAARRARPRPAVLTSLRDILVAKKRPDRVAEMLELAERHCDRVLVHGDPSFVALDETFPQTARLAERIRYTGYAVARETVPTVSPARAEVLVSAGGGAVAEPLLKAAMAARKATRLARLPWIYIAGPNLPEADYAALAETVPEGGHLVRTLPDFRERLAACALSISQAGYNTVAETLACGVRAVLVPYARDGETEQALRAQRLAEMGRVATVEEAVLSPQSLAAAVDLAAAQKVAEVPIRLDGVVGTVAAVAEALRQVETGNGERWE